MTSEKTTKASILRDIRAARDLVIDNEWQRAYTLLAPVLDAVWLKARKEENGAKPYHIRVKVDTLDLYHVYVGGVLKYTNLNHDEAVQRVLAIIEQHAVAKLVEAPWL